MSFKFSSHSLVRMECVRALVSLFSKIWISVLHTEYDIIEVFYTIAVESVALECPFYDLHAALVQLNFQFWSDCTQWIVRLLFIFIFDALDLMKSHSKWKTTFQNLILVKRQLVHFRMLDSSWNRIKRIIFYVEYKNEPTKKAEVRYEKAIRFGSWFATKTTFSETFCLWLRSNERKENKSFRINT